MNEKNMNMIHEVIPYYPVNRLHTKCDRSERLFNLVLTMIMNPNNKQHLKELIETLSKLIPFEEDGRSDMWEKYSAAVIRYCIAQNSWNLSEEDLRDFFSANLADLTYGDPVMEQLYIFAEALIEARQKASYKRHGTIYWGARYGGTRFECESRLRKVMDDTVRVLHQHEAYREYAKLLDVIFEDTSEQWNELNRTGFDGLREYLKNLPDRLILFADKVYVVTDVDKYREASYREVIDDVEFDRYESGLRITLRNPDDGQEQVIKIKSMYADMSYNEIFFRNNLKLPDLKTRELFKEFA